MLEEIKEFRQYVNDFYNLNGGIYPIATTEEINTSIMLYFLTNDIKKIDFDSIDRENVRTIINK